MPSAGFSLRMRKIQLKPRSPGTEYSFDGYPEPTVTELYLSADPNCDMLLFMPGFLPMRRYHKKKPGYTASAGDHIDEKNAEPNRTIMFRSYGSFFGSSPFEYCDTIHRDSALANIYQVKPSFEYCDTIHRNLESFFGSSRFDIAIQ